VPTFRFARAARRNNCGGRRDSALSCGSPCAAGRCRQGKRRYCGYRRSDQGVGRVDILVNNAGDAWISHLLDTSDDDWRYSPTSTVGDVEVTGAGEVMLQVALTVGDDANLVVKLCDVDSAGLSTLITTGCSKRHITAACTARSVRDRPGLHLSYPAFVDLISRARWASFSRQHFGCGLSARMAHSAQSSAASCSRRRPPSAVTIPVVPAASEVLRGLLPLQNLARAAAAMTPSYKIENDVVQEPSR
jgi:hypothetical protein